MRILNHFIIGWGLLATLLTAAPELAVNWSAQQCLPGDVITLRVKITNSEVTGFDLKLPISESIEWVSHERGPVRYESGVYSQEDTVVAQPKQPGTIHLNGLHAVVRDGEAMTNEILSAPPLMVGSFADLADDFTPELLPAREINVGMKRTWWLWGLACLVMVAVIFICRRKPAKAIQETAIKSVSDEIAEILAPEKIALSRVERFLAERSNEISAEIRESLEAAVYGRAMDVELLRKQLELEVAR